MELNIFEFIFNGEHKLIMKKFFHLFFVFNDLGLIGIP
jgi:hypothetical protein